MTHTAVYKRLKSLKKEIIDGWEQRVCKEVSAAKLQSRPALLDSLPSFLDNLADIIHCEERGEEVVEGQDLGEEHGKQRFGLEGYSLSQVVTEYRVLRQVVFETLLSDDEYGPNLVRMINDAIDRGICNAVAAFAQKQRAEDRRIVELELEASQEQLLQMDRDRELREQFVATLSHDLRNPIGAAKVALDLLMQEIVPDEESKELIDILSRSLVRSEVMLKDLLDVNRINSGRRLPLTVNQVDLEQISERIVSDLASLHGQRFVFKSSGTVLGEWDSDNLKRMLENLLSNAVKYGDKDGEVTLTLVQNPEYTEVRVHNSGLPISIEDQKTIFDAYTRAKSREDGAYKGWGLGLTLVRAVAEAHGGRAEVQSSKDHGTTFIVIIPNAAQPFD